ncbi:glutaredoxin 3 [Methylopila capsulata]|uniref:Glutaredoxin n=1 Tax=Methylopila capsulata TaxID=61654 RepID=A0A9W6IT13_9HYPH|nr:glutaredoxin 3 [Methylopila capsulata]MBM7851630.1 glutaredoxin 3 [Methylopila capsulata]GLK54690.1 glutaredoxin 3 [Methylopila capsulata]
MPTVTIYSRVGCPYCDMAKSLLRQKSVAFDEIDVGRAPDRRPEMIAKSGGRTTVPQIFIDGRHVGGCDDLYALDEGGGLDPLLAA